MSGVRVGHDERTEVLDRLGQAFEAGLLPVAEYDARVVAVGTAAHADELRRQVADLPPEYAWSPPDPRPADVGSQPTAAAGRVALILGIASVPLAFCLVGGVLGVLAVIASRRRGPRTAGGRLTTALIGRIFGILGIALSIAAAISLWYARKAQLGP